MAIYVARVLFNTISVFFLYGKRLLITRQAGLILFAIFCTFYKSNAQAPIINPKSNIVLKLDATGNYAVQLPDVATITTSDNIVPTVSLSPANFNCSNLGPQKVTVVATGHQANPAAVSFNGDENLFVDPSGNIIVSNFKDGILRYISNTGQVSNIGDGSGGPYSETPGQYSVDFPVCEAMDKDGNIYVGVANQPSYSIDKITPAGVVSILVSTYAINNSTDGPKGTATVFGIYSMVCDNSGNLYFTEALDNKVRMMSPDGTITTIAGSNLGYSGFTNGTGSGVLFGYPTGIVMDQSGNFYISDRDNFAIRKMTPQGVVTTFAGGTPGFKDGTGTAAQFLQPFGITIDNQGNLYVADSFNYAIRKITPAGVVTTLAGGTYGLTNGTGSQASFGAFYSIGADSQGNIFVADYSNNVVRKITPTGVVTTYAGSGLYGDMNGNILDGAGPSSTLQIPVTVVSSPQFSPYADDIITAGADCKAVIPDYTINPKLTDACSSIQLKVTQTPAAGTPLPLNNTTGVTLTANDGNGGTASVSFNVTAYSQPVITPLPGPVILKLDATGNYTVKLADVATVSDCNNTPQIQLTPSTFTCSTLGPQTVTLVASSGQLSPTTPSAVSFNYPDGVATDAQGNIYIADTFNNKIKKLTPSGAVTTFAGSGQPGSADGQGSNATFDQPENLVVDAMGNIYVANFASNKIRKIDPSGNVTTFAGNGTLTTSDGIGTAAGINEPDQIAIDAAGNLYVAGYGDNRVRKITPSAVVSTLAGTGALGANNGPGNTATFRGPRGICIDPSGNIYVSDVLNSLIRKITPAGVVSTYAGNGTQGRIDGKSNVAEFDDPTGMLADASGNIYVTDNKGIRKIDPSGNVTTLTTSTGSSIVFDNYGNIILADRGDHEIKRISPSGVVTIIAGSGNSGDQNGSVGVISNFPSATMQIPVIVKSSLVITSVYKDVSIHVNNVCPTSLPDYTKTATATDNCSNNITYTQVPEPGSIISGTSPIVVTITATDQWNTLATASFRVIPDNNPQPAASVIINTASTTICNGTPVTFTAAPANAGIAPVYQWKINGSNTGSNQSTYSNDNLANGDIISCVITTAGDCPATAASNLITMTVNQNLSPSVTIVAAGNSICAGYNATFTATTQNGGSDPSYQWQVNGINVGGNSPSYSNNSLADGDKVTCIVTNNDHTCLVSTTASSTIPIIVNQLVTPTVSISASVSGTVCSGTSITFTATPTNADDAPTYIWQVNGVTSGTNNPVFVTSSLANGDVVSCNMITGGKCLAIPSVISNLITVSINAAINPTIKISPANPEICSGEPLTFTASSDFTPPDAIFQWAVNNINIDANGSSFTSSSLVDDDIVTCTISSKASCLIPSSTLPVKVKIDQVPKVVFNNEPQVKPGNGVKLTPVTSDNVVTYQWSPATGLDDPASRNPVASPAQTTTYSLTVITSAGCQASASVTVSVVADIIVPNAFTPNNDGINDVWTITSLIYYPNCLVNVYNRYGQLTYQSKGYSKPWDGTIKGSQAPTGTYYYIIDLNNGSQPLSGYVTVIR